MDHDGGHRTVSREQSGAFMDSVVVNGVRIGFERVGAGPTVLLAGGTGMPPIAWQACGFRDALTEAG
jgi:hypothetical protein